MDDAPQEFTHRLITLKTLAEQLDADPSSVRRWLRAAGIRPVIMSNGPKPAIRFKSAEIEAWLANRELIT